VYIPLRTSFLSIFLVLGFFVSSAIAQVPDRYELRVIAVSSTTTDYLAGPTESLWGIGVAGVAEWQVGSSFSVLSQLEYAPRGIRQRLADTDADSGSQLAGAETRLHYLSMPLLAKASYSFEDTPLALYVKLGPRVDLMIGSESGTFEFEDGDVSADLDERYDQAALGLTGGIGLQFNVSERIALTLEARQHRDVTVSVEEGGTSRVNTTVGNRRNLATDYSIGIRWE
jgi:opacity protein-like surface antigen